MSVKVCRRGLESWTYFDTVQELGQLFGSLSDADDLNNEATLDGHGRSSLKSGSPSTPSSRNRQKNGNRNGGSVDSPANGSKVPP